MREHLPDTALPLRQRLAAWALLGLPLLGLVIVGGALGWIHPAFAAVLVLGAAILVPWVVNRRERWIRRTYERLRLNDLRRALRGQRLALGTSVVDGLPDPLFILNRQREVTLTNQAARALFSRGVVGRDLALVLRQPQILAVVDRALEAGEPGETEVSLLAPVHRQFHVRVAPLPAGESEDTESPEDEAQRPVAALSLHEITEIRQAESMRADFVANASHELRTPLSSLVGFIETLRGPARDDAEARDHFLDIMQREADRMARLINDLLSLSRIEQAEHMAPEARVDIADVMKSVASTIEMRAQEGGITLDLDIPEDLPPVKGDSDQLTQVFQNLLDNAVKYTPEGGTVTLTAEKVDRLPDTNQPGIMVAVRDTGEGIRPEHLPRLTERFYRVDTGRSRKLGGTGLGLAIVKHITRRHRGWLDIQSTPGEGTIVYVGLPLYQTGEGMGA